MCVILVCVAGVTRQGRAPSMGSILTAGALGPLPGVPQSMEDFSLQFLFGQLWSPRCTGLTADTEQSTDLQAQCEG